ncbi:hypothetical protein [Anaerotignum propionicum]|uniref:hypothetical protein n=1 Tax=Anaerotignum propionicum TaxID=28446 RepID=UPI00210A965F|nr:hypothetical protein [Anaerotignum propionicum]MCQ4934999.1 hypothetical protein [Anaerotignum propionicum]
MENLEEYTNRIQERDNAINGYLEKLNGITCEEWKRLSMIINKSFELEKEKLNRDIQLPDKDTLDRATHSLFG